MAFECADGAGEAGRFADVLPFEVSGEEGAMEGIARPIGIHAFDLESIVMLDGLPFEEYASLHPLGDEKDFGMEGLIEG